MDSAVSVIIPVYNPGVALGKCLESLMSQSYSDIEFILVDDGSTDGSDIICQEFASKDDRIIYVRQENSGVSASRNSGLDIAKGRYVCFIDSDDYVDSDYVSAMVDAMMKSDADIVIQGLKMYENNEPRRTEEFEPMLVNVEDMSDKLFDRIFYYTGPYCKLFKTSIIRTHGLSFPADMAYGEDAVFYFSYLEHCRSVQLIPNKSYNYMIANQGSLSTKILSPDKFWQNQSNRRGAYRNLRETFGLSPVLSETEQACKLTGIGGMLNSIFKSGADDISVCRYLDIMACDEDFRLSDIRATGLHHKLIIHLIKSNDKISRRILKRIYR